MKELLNPELDQEIERIRCELQQIEARISCGTVEGHGAENTGEANEHAGYGRVHHEPRSGRSEYQASPAGIRLTPKFCLYCMGMGLILGCFVYWVAGNL